MSNYSLDWQSYSQWAPTDNEVGGIYSDEVTFHAVGEYTFKVNFRVGENRILGLLFCDVTTLNPRDQPWTLHYCFGQFYKNSGAKLFAQFALNHFIETETWGVCPSFQPIDWVDGTPHTLGGDEIVSEII